MITINNLSINFGERDILYNANLFIGPHDRIGLVGHNGAGKSTLLKCLAGLYKDQQKAIAMTKGIQIGYLPQEMEHNLEATVLEEAETAFQEIQSLEQQSEFLTLQLATREDYQSTAYADIIDELEHVNHRLEVLGVKNREQLIEKVLKGLGFVSSDLNKKIGTFSGGWQMRVQIAKLLLQQPELLLLDEPTNHLDIISIEWLEKFLTTYDGAIVLISHDRLFLDNVTQRTVEVLKGKLYDFKLPYSKYMIHRQEDVENQKRAYENQQKYIEDTQKLIDKFRAKANKAAFAQSLIKKLDKLERIEIDAFNTSSLHMRFSPAPRSGKILIQAEQLSKNYGEHNIFEQLDLTVARQDRLAIVGKNGIGKSTLMRILKGDEQYDGDLQVGQNVSIGYYAQNQAEELDPEKTVFDTIDDVATGEIRNKIRGLLGAFLFSGDDIDKKVKVLSGGEKARLALCKLMLEPVNLLFLDEPTNHLDLRSKQILKEALLAYDGTLIVISHDRDFLDQLTEKILEITPKGLKEFRGGIMEFLQSKNADSIQQFEKTKKEKKSNADSESEPVLSYNERKALEKKKRKLKNQVDRCEKEIESLEQDIESAEEALRDLDYSDKEKTEITLGNFNKLKEQLEKKMEEWAAADLELAEIESA